MTDFDQPAVDAECHLAGVRSETTGKGSGRWLWAQTEGKWLGVSQQPIEISGIEQNVGVQQKNSGEPVTHGSGDVRHACGIIA